MNILLRETFSKVKNTYLPIIVIFIVTIILSFISNGFSNLFPVPFNIFLAVNLSLLINAWNICSVYTYVYNKLSAENVNFQNCLRQDFPKLIKVVIANIVIFIFMSMGFLLLVAPGFYILFRLILTVPIISIEKSSIIKAIKKSWDVTENNVLPIFLFLGIISTPFIFGYLIAFQAPDFGLVVFILGLIFAIPINLTFITIVYKKLVEEKQKLLI